MISLSLWSGPRNLSTALMYFFAHRGDFKVWDEPFFGVFLKESNRWRPSREEALQAMSLNTHEVLEQLNAPVGQHLFLKNMANHWSYIPEDARLQWPAIILFRDPRFVFQSYHKQMESFDMLDLGYAEQVAIFQGLKQSEQKVYLQCSEELAQQPKIELQRLCKYFDIPFEASMLHWSPGALAEDGVWAKYWYERVHLSSGFEARSAQNPPPVRVQDQKLYEECLPYYQILKSAYDEQIQSS